MFFYFWKNFFTKLFEKTQNMDFIDRLQDISVRIAKMKEQVQTEEATKNAFVMPFISALGYDVFNPLEVVPEYIADIGTKKGEKVDYCILKEEKPIMIVECKHWKETLDVHKTQLHRYFHVTDSRFGVLTNGLVYRFYADLEESNKMDGKPFLEFSLENINPNLVGELKKFQKDNFDIENILSSASDLKYSKQIKEVLGTELKEPSEDFIKYFASRVYSGRVTSKILEQFGILVKKSAKSLLNEMINERLTNALNDEKSKPVAEEESQGEVVEDVLEEVKNGIITTEEEKEGFRIIQAILRKDIDLNRISDRDTKSYFGVLLDNNNRKPICRLHFNGGKKYLGLFDENKKENRVHLETLEQIFNYSEQLLKTALKYDKSE